jgi:hypothetical protein
MSDTTPSLQASLGLGVLGAMGVTLFLVRDSLEWEVWGPPLVVFGGAVAGGIGLALTMGRDEAEAGAVEAAGETEDLEQRRADALQALAALESQQSQMAPEDYAAERKALLAMGADAMRRLDHAGNAPVPAAPAAPAPGAPVSNPNALAEGVTRLTEALARGDIDEITYAKAVAALSDTQAAPVPQQATMPVVPPDPVAAPVAAPVVPPAMPASKPAPGLAPQWTGAIYTVVGLGLIGTLLYFVSNDAGPRREGAGMTGNQELSSGERPPASTEGAFQEQLKEKMKERLAANANDLEALNTLTQLNFADSQQAWTYNRKALEVDPENPDALVNEALITAMMGMPDKAHEKFDAVLAKHPENAGGWAYKGMVLMQAERYADAIAPLEKAIQLGLKDPQLSNALAVARAGGQPSARPPMGSPPPAAGGAVIASGTVDLAPARNTYAGKKVFVSVADPASPRPPLAAVQLPPGPFPMTFEITEGHKIAMGGDRPIPDTVILTVRLDADGNAMPEPSDPVAKMPGVAKGTTGMKLTLE